jgi:hypothetical protein
VCVCECIVKKIYKNLFTTNKKKKTKKMQLFHFGAFLEICATLTGREGLRILVEFEFEFEFTTAISDLISLKNKSKERNERGIKSKTINT